MVMSVPAAAALAPEPSVPKEWRKKRRDYGTRLRTRPALGAVFLRDPNGRRAAMNLSRATEPTMGAYDW